MQNYGYLTNEEYRAIRKTLGFSQDEAASFHGIKRKETLVWWENGKSTISVPACEKITDFLNKTYEIIEDVINDWEKDKEQEVVFITYDDQDYRKYIFGLGRTLPNSVHTALMYRAYIELKRLGAKAYIVKFNKSSYAYFLTERGSEDTPEMREKWSVWYRFNYFNVLPEHKEERRITKHTTEQMFLYLINHPDIKGFKRYYDIVELRQQGNNLTQVAQILGVSKQRINKMWHDLDDMLDE